jgi:hypothetical protein
MLSKLMKPGLIAIGLLSLTLFAAAACSDDDDDASAQETDAIAELEARVERSEVLGALNTLNATGFHTIDEEMQVAEEVEEFTASTIERAYQVSSSTEWPEPLAEKAEVLNDTMVEFIEALEAEDLQASKGLATDTHDAWHDLEHDAYTWVSGEQIEAHEEEEEASESASPEATNGG